MPALKIKLEIKSSPTSQNPLFTIFMENKTADLVELLITRFNVKQLEFSDKNPVAQKSDVPINDGILTMDKANLKKFIQSLQLLVKN